MALTTIDKKEWENYFNAISKKLPKDQMVELRISGKSIGDQVEEEWSPLLGLSYEKKTNALFIHTPILGHPITRLEGVVSIEDEDQLEAISVRDEEGVVQTIQFRDPFNYH